MEKPTSDQWFDSLRSAAYGAGLACDYLAEAHGLPLVALTRPAPRGRPRIYISAGIHADEPAGPLALVRLMKSGFFDDRYAWVLCPMLNPGAWDAGTRESRDGIDLNRDYRHPRSPEVRAHRAWLERQPPNDLYLSLHEDWEATGFYLYEINTSGAGSVAGAILERVGPVIPPEPMRLIDNHEVTAPGIIQHKADADEPENWPEAIFHAHLYPHLSYTFETPSALDLDVRVEALSLAVQAAVDAVNV